MTLKHTFELLLLAALWGASFLFMRTASPEFGPFALVEVRTGLAALFLLPFLFKGRGHRDLRQHWFSIMIVGLTNTAIPFCLFSYSAIYLEAGFTSILNATAPIFAALLSWVWLKEKLSPLAMFGLLMGFFGVSVISSGAMSADASVTVIPILSALGATFFYGIAACYTRKSLIGVNPMAVATGSQIFAALAVLPLALLFLPERMPSSEAWIHTIVLGIAGTGIAYILYFDLIAKVGAAKAITVAYLVPVFGVIWGIVFLNETVTLLTLTGAGLILCGVSLATGLVKWPRKPKAIAS